MEESRKIPFDPSLLGPFFRYNDGTVTGGANPVQLVPQNPYRVGLIFGASGAAVTYRFVQPPSGALSLVNPNGQPPVVYTWAQHGALVQQQVWLASGAPTVYFMEVIWQTPSPEG